MLDRRLLVTGLCGLAAGCAASAAPPAAPAPAPVAAAPEQDLAAELAAAQPFDQFLEGVRAEARRSGISQATLNRALTGLRPNQRVIELDRRQAEGALSWEEYRDRIMLSPTRIQNGRRMYAENGALLDRVASRYQVRPAIVVAIWGVETNFGGNTGGFGVIEALATLAWEGRRASYFRRELMAALRILDEGHIAPDRMRGSWAGAMGQPQFMPTNFDRLAVDFDGDGRRDIWDNRADALGSIANYFHRNGWRMGEPWGREAAAPPGFNAEGDDSRRPLRDFARLGFRNIDGSPLPPAEIETFVITPNRGSGQVFLCHHNFRVIRRYNSPINYALCVGLLADRISA